MALFASSDIRPFAILPEGKGARVVPRCIGVAAEEAPVSLFLGCGWLTVSTRWIRRVLVHDGHEDGWDIQRA
jgi:hypothetical protein